MKLRHRRWKFATKLQPLVAVVSSGRRYVTDGSNDGVIEVLYKQDIEELLNPSGDLQSDYEIAYEAYGLKVDSNGKFLPEEKPEPEVSNESERNGTSDGDDKKEPAGQPKTRRRRKKMGRKVRAK